MIERIMTSIADETSIREFVLVTGYLANVIEEYFGDGAKWGWHVEYVPQEIPRGVGDAVNTARDYLRSTPFLMTYGDIMLDPVNYGRFEKEHIAVTSSSPDCKALVGLNWVDDPYRGAAVTLGADNWIERIDEKPPKGMSKTNWNNAGLFIFDPLIFEYTSKIAPSARGEYELPDAITALINAGHRARGLELVGSWRDVGTPEDYAAINQEFEGTAK